MLLDSFVAHQKYKFFRYRKNLLRLTEIYEYKAIGRKNALI